LGGGERCGVGKGYASHRRRGLRIPEPERGRTVIAANMHGLANFRKFKAP